MSKPLIGIFVRHSAECKHADDELYRRWSCRQHLRWTHNGVQYRKTAGTGSWADAEQAKCTLEEQLAGRTCAPSSENNAQAIAGAVSLFIANKSVQGLSPDLIKKYTLWWAAADVLRGTRSLRCKGHSQRTRHWALRGLAQALPKHVHPRQTPRTLEELSTVLLRGAMAGTRASLAKDQNRGTADNGAHGRGV